MPDLQAFFIQYQVNLRRPFPRQTAVPQGIATVIVFADNEHIARTRAGRIASDNDLEITGFLRIHLLRNTHLEMLDNVVSRLYTKAELYGLALHCDLFPTGASCCDKRDIHPWC